MSVVQLSDVSRTYRDGEAAIVALSGVTLTVDEGETVAVMGPSGSGKSTLLNLAGGLDLPTSGQVRLGDDDVASLDAAARAVRRRRYAGFVFQDHNLVATLTCAENVALPLELDGTRPQHARTQALAALAEAGAEGLADRFPDRLSGGQRQRVAIARALVGGRPLILADEPTGALDSVTAEEIMTVLRARVRSGTAVLLVTHEPRYAAWADRIVFLRDGRIVDDTGVAESWESLLWIGRDPL